MAVVLGRASRPSFDIAAAMRKNRELDLEEQKLRAAQDAANIKAAFGGLEALLGGGGGGSGGGGRSRSRSGGGGGGGSPSNNLTQQIQNEDNKWRQFREQWRQKGFTHDGRQTEELTGIAKEVDRLNKLYMDAWKKGDQQGALQYQQQILQTKQGRWQHQMETEIPPEMREIDGENYLRDASGNWKATGTLRNAQRLRVTAEAREVFEDAYKTGSNFNEALDDQNDFLIRNGLPPSNRARKISSDDGYKYNDPYKASALDKSKTEERQYLRTMGDKIWLSLQGFDKEGVPLFTEEEQKALFKERWVGGGYEQMEKRLGATQFVPQRGGPQATGSGVPQNVTEAIKYLEGAQQYEDRLARRGLPLPDPVGFKTNTAEALKLVEAYKAANPERFPYLPRQGAPQQGAPRQAPQQGAPRQGAPQQGAPQQGAPQQGAPQQGAPRPGLPETQRDGQSTDAFLQLLRDGQSQSGQPPFGAVLPGPRGNWPLVAPQGGQQQGPQSLEQRLRDIYLRSQSGQQPSGAVVPGLRGVGPLIAPQGGQQPSGAVVPGLRGVGPLIAPSNTIPNRSPLDYYQPLNYEQPYFQPQFDPVGEPEMYDPYIEDDLMNYSDYSDYSDYS